MAVTSVPVAGGGRKMRQGRSPEDRRLDPSQFGRRAQKALGTGQALQSPPAATPLPRVDFRLVGLRNDE